MNDWWSRDDIRSNDIRSRGSGDPVGGWFVYMPCFTSLSARSLRVHPDPQRQVQTGAPKQSPRSVIFHRATRDSRTTTQFCFYEKIETWKGSLSPELSASDKTSEKRLHWFLAHWRKQDGQKLRCSRKWRSKEGPAQALHSCSLPLQLYKLNAAGQDSSKLWHLRWHCNCFILWIPRLLETLDVPQFWDCTGYQLASSCLVWCLLFTGWQESCFSELGPV